MGSAQAGFCTRQEGLREDSRQHWDRTTINYFLKGSTDLLPSDLVWMLTWTCVGAIQDINLTETQYFFSVGFILILFRELDCHTGAVKEPECHQGWSE